MSIIGISILALGILMVLTAIAMFWILSSLPISRYTVMLRAACVLLVLASVSRMPMILASDWYPQPVHVASLFIQSSLITTVSISDFEFLKTLLPFVGSLSPEFAFRMQILVAIMAIPYHTSAFFSLVSKDTLISVTTYNVMLYFQTLWPIVLAAGTLAQVVYQAYIVIFVIKNASIVYRVVYVALIVVSVVLIVIGGYFNLADIEYTPDMLALSGYIVLVILLVPISSIEVLRRLLINTRLLKSSPRRPLAVVKTNIHIDPNDIKFSDIQGPPMPSVADALSSLHIPRHNQSSHVSNMAVREPSAEVDSSLDSPTEYEGHFWKS